MKQDQRVNFMNAVTQTGAAVSIARLSKAYRTREDDEVLALDQIDLDFEPGSFVAVVGPSGCGKSTFLRSINRLNDLIPGCRVTGDMKIAGQNIYDPKVDLVNLRREVGLVFQKPNPFPKSIYENIAYGPVNKNTVSLLDKGVQANMPTTPENIANQVGMDVTFWADYGEQLEQRFNAWAAK